MNILESDAVESIAEHCKRNFISHFCGIKQTGRSLQRSVSSVAARLRLSTPVAASKE